MPVGLAYGEPAGLPMAGLYGSMLPLLAYAMFGSSRHLVVGPDTAMAAIVAVTVAPLELGDPVRLALLAAGLGVMVGLISLLAGVLRLGIGTANLISGLTQGLPISASDTRTAVAEVAGSQTQVTMVVAAAIVGEVTLWLADLLHYLPTAALGGILIASAWGLCLAEAPYPVHRVVIDGATIHDVDLGLRPAGRVGA